MHAEASNLFVKRAIASLITHPLVGRLIRKRYAGLIPHRGKKIETPPNAVASVDSMLFFGIYESAEIRFVHRYIDGSLDVVELGSSIGGVSCEIAERLSDRKRLICVEANQGIFDFLRRNLARNAPRQSVAFSVGAIDYSGSDEVELAIGATNLSSALAEASSETPAISVPAMTLSRVLADHQIQRFALVADIEGAEAGIFSKDVKSLDGCELLIAELHETNHDGVHYSVDDLLSMLHENSELRLVDRYGPVCVLKK